MPQFTLLYGARQLLTLRGPSGARRGSHLQDLAIIENGSILIENGLIHSLGSTRRIENLKEANNALTIDVSGSIILPGLVDPDVTVTCAGSSIARSRRPSRIYDDGLALMRSCLEQGTVAAVLTVCSEAPSFDSDMCLLRQFKKIGSNPVDIVRSWHVGWPPEQGCDLRSFERALRMLAKGRLIDCISISSAVAASDYFRPYLARILNTALPIQLRWRGGLAIAGNLLRDIAPRTISCASSLSAEEIATLATSDAIAVFAPGSEVGRTSGRGLRQLIDAGGAVALSSGYHPVHSRGFSMQMAVSLATVQGGLSAEEAIVAATVNAAHAAGCGETTGVIEKGRRANLLVLNIPDYREIPRQFGINRVRTVLKDGEVVLNRAGWKMDSSAAAAGAMRSEYF